MPAFDTLMLENERLRLRPLRADDAEALFSLHSDPRVMEFWSTTPWTSLDKAHETIREDQRALPLGEHLRLALELKSAPGLVGVCTLYKFSLQSRRAELGYALSPAQQGKGLMHDALRLLLDHAFGTLGLNRVEADIDPRNAASRNCLLRLGFREEGRLRERWIVGGVVSDTGLYGLLASDWKAAVESPEPAIVIRAFRHADTAALTRLWSQTFTDDPPRNEPGRLIASKLAHGDELLLVAIEEGRLNGAIMAGWDGVRGWLYHLAVARDARRRGLGGRLVREAESRLLALGCTKVNLQVRSCNRAVVSFYCSLGYRVEDHVSMGRVLGD
ncbi:MAG: GNAT family acetyltransferase [Candidatus Cloacimonetes bacterium]|nr:GNAT family acetyltransferase [Candidatus Cloacimonadota bacterium]